MDAAVKRKPGGPNNVGTKPATILKYRYALRLINEGLTVAAALSRANMSSETFYRLKKRMHEPK